MRNIQIREGDNLTSILLNYLKSIPTEVIYSIIIFTSWFIAKYVLNCVITTYIKTQSIGKMYLRYCIDFIITAIAIFYFLSLFPVTAQLLSVILASSGLIVAVLGFAAQESLGNVIHGFTIILFKPFEINDKITLRNANITGRVKSITLRHTILQTYNNSYITIPNSVVNKDIIENYNLKDPQTRSFIDLEVSYETDVRYAIEVIKECVAAHPLVLQTEDRINNIHVQVRDFNASGVALRVNVWTATVEENFKACSDLRVTLLETFKEKGIEIPYPHMQLVYPTEKQ